MPKYPRTTFPKLQTESIFFTKQLSKGMKLHVKVLAPRRTERVLSQRYAPLIILKNSDA